MGDTPAPEGRDAPAQSGGSGRRAFLLPVVFGGLSGLILLWGITAYQSYKHANRKESEALLTAVAGLKVGELVQWRKERLGDATVLQRSPMVASLVRQALTNPPSPEALRQLRAWLQVTRDAYGYERAMLLDGAGTLRLSVPDTGKPAPTHLGREISGLLRQGEVGFLDFHRDDGGSPVRLAVVAPICVEPGAGAASALMVLQIDPSEYLYPLIQRWPTSSRTAETLVVRHEGNAVVYLNELRFESNTALRLRRPLSDRALPSAMAATGHEGMVEGVDYRGRPVLAALRQIPGSGWALVARMDLDEIDAPVRERLLMLTGLVVALLGLVGAGWMTFWRQQRTRFYRERYEVERTFRTLFESMAEGVALHELVRDAAGRPVDYRVLDCNPAFERHTGISPDRAQGTLASELYGTGQAPYLDLWARVAETGAPHALEVYFPPLRRHFNISAVSPGPGQFATVFEDITARKEHEAELRSKTDEMERFTYTISHDLKSPLVTVQTFLGYLKEDQEHGNRERMAEDMGYISAAAERMSRLLDELLRMSRLGRVVNPPVRVSFSELVQEALGAVAGQIATRGVNVLVAERELVLHGDRPRLVEIWQNLLDNAVKFMGEQTQPRIEVGVEVESEDSVFFVRDNGRGIDPRHQDKVFGLFERLDAKGEGTGLGLAVVKRIVELCGGRIWVESAGPGQGSCFRFTLPRVLGTDEGGETT